MSAQQQLEEFTLSWTGVWTVEVNQVVETRENIWENGMSERSAGCYCQGRGCSARMKANRTEDELNLSNLLLARRQTWASGERRLPFFDG